MYNTSVLWLNGTIDRLGGCFYGWVLGYNSGGPFVLAGEIVNLRDWTNLGDWSNLGIHLSGTEQANDILMEYNDDN